MTDGQNITPKLRAYVEQVTGNASWKVVRLPQGGSERVYLRFLHEGDSLLAAYNPVPEENHAFCTMAGFFREQGLPVPEVYHRHQNGEMYLQEDLGDCTLYSLVKELWKEPGAEGRVHAYYRKVIDMLVRFHQVGAGLDFHIGYPRGKFDERSILWDLNYFKYLFLKLQRVSFHENRLEEDFLELARRIAEAGTGYFLYRDFQSRNIMLREGELYFIDFQGGRKGPPLYDLASLLYDARAGLTGTLRKDLAGCYFSKMADLSGLPAAVFEKQYPWFILLRKLQAMGAYGFRGLYERKLHFMKSIPQALENLHQLLEEYPEYRELPELFQCLQQLTAKRPGYAGPEPGRLEVNIRSFSYKTGMPSDPHHGGGFVFDCRALPNPGRLQEMRDLTGEEEQVMQFLEHKEEVVRFMNNSRLLVEQAVKNYLERGFTRLSVGFGCTGGQHRSVYCARKLAEVFERQEGIDVKLHHRELEV